jgi:hypothetical protein
VDQFAIYFKAVCCGTVSGMSACRRVGVSACRRIGVSACATRRALFTDGTYETHGTNVMARPRTKTRRKPYSLLITDY